jgi:hypothetical protein
MTGGARAFAWRAFRPRINHVRIPIRGLEFQPRASIRAAGGLKRTHEAHIGRTEPGRTLKWPKLTAASSSQE